MQRSSRGPWCRRTAAALGGALLLVLVPTFARGQPRAESLAGLQSTAADVRSQIARLDRCAEVAVEKYNLARTELDRLSVRLSLTRRDLVSAQEQLDAAQRMLGERLAEAYKSDEVDVLDILLAASDVTEIDTQISYMRSVNEADMDAVTGIETLARSVERLTVQLEKDRATALAREMDLREKQADIEDQLAERRALLADLDGRVKRMLERQARLAAAASRKLAHAAGVDIDSINGSAAQLAVVRETMKHLGIPYVWGGASPSGGFDCSGLVLYVYAKFGVQFPHGATLQARMGTPVPLSRMQPADLVFFGDASFYQHVGIYIGKGLFIEAPHTGDVVKVSELAGRGCALACRYPIRLR